MKMNVLCPKNKFINDEFKVANKELINNRFGRI